MNERMLVADDTAGHPPVRHVRMFRIGYEDRSPAAEVRRIPMANTPQFLPPNSAVGQPTFGRILEARDPRILQFGLKFFF